MKFRFVLLLIVLVLFTVLILQNSDVTIFKVFLWQFSTALSLLVVITGVLGIILGIIIGKLLDSKKLKAAEAIEKDQKTKEIKQDNPDIRNPKTSNLRK